MTDAERAKNTLHEMLAEMVEDDGCKNQSMMYEKLRKLIDSVRQDLLLSIECQRCCGVEFESRKYPAS